MCLNTDHFGQHRLRHRSLGRQDVQSGDAGMGQTQRTEPPIPRVLDTQGLRTRFFWLGVERDAELDEVGVELGDIPWVALDEGGD